MKKEKAKARERNPQYSHGYRKEIVRRCLENGAISGGEFVLDGAEYSRSGMRHAIAKMEQEGTLIGKRIGQGKIWRLSDFEKNSYMYLPYQEKGLYGYYNNFMKKRAEAASQKDRRVRIAKIIESAYFFNGADVKTGFKEKTDCREKAITEFPCFYGTDEEQEWGVTDMTNLSIRMGSLLTQDEVFSVYNIKYKRSKINKTEYTEELVLKRKIEELLPGKYHKDALGKRAVILYREKQAVIDMIEMRAGKNLELTLMNINMPFSVV